MKWILAASAGLVVGVILVVWLWTPDLDRVKLESRYSNGPADFIDLAGIRLHVRDSGPTTAPALILLHGFGSSLHTWEPWARKLAQEFRVIRFDLPGSGLSGSDPNGNYSDTRSLHILAALMDRRGIAKASLIGNSIGGRIAWRFAAEFPTRVERLILVSPDGFASPGFEYGRKPDVPSALKLMQHVLPKSILRMNLAAAYADPAALTDMTVARYHDLMRAPGVRAALFARMEQTVLQDPIPILRRITAPTLLLWGDKDAMIPIANAQDYVRALPQGTLANLEGLGHVPQEESPERSLAPVLDFLRN